MLGDIAPKLAELSDDVLFGDVWERPQLSKRDRSLITCEELIEMITHLSFYAGWPSALSAALRTREIFAAD